MTVLMSVHCDRCGAVIDDDRHAFEVRSGSLRQRAPAPDLCPRCFSDWLAWLDGDGGDLRLDPPERRSLRGVKRVLKM